MDYLKVYLIGSYLSHVITFICYCSYPDELKFKEYKKTHVVLFLTTIFSWFAVALFIASTTRRIIFGDEE